MSKRSAKMIDEEALEAFSSAMRSKLTRKRAEGRSGWQNLPLDELWNMVKNHIEKAEYSESSFLDEHQLVDIANLSMFLWARREEFSSTVRTCEHCGNAVTNIHEG